MDRDKAVKGNELIKEIDELKSYKDITNRAKNTVHFEFREHFGGNGKEIRISRRHNDKFISVVDEIISELERELRDL